MKHFDQNIHGFGLRDNHDSQLGPMTRELFTPKHEDSYYLAGAVQ